MGGYLRVQARTAGFEYTPDFIVKTALGLLDGAIENLYRILYYDCAPYAGSQRRPVSGEATSWTGSDQWLHDLSRRDYFAVRRGILKFRGFKLRRIPYQPQRALVD